jgi:putative endonuclease
MKTGKRVNAHRNGVTAERLALWSLRLKGWRLVAGRHSGRRGSGVGEVDLIMRRGGVLAFVEVKYRPTLDAAAAAISSRQQRRIVHAARSFLAANADLNRLTLRFDAVLLAPRRWPRHVINAWTADA